MTIPDPTARLLTEAEKEDVVNPAQSLVTGVLKFFFQNESYGFLVEDEETPEVQQVAKKDVFFHLDDLNKNGGAYVSKELLI